MYCTCGCGKELGIETFAYAKKEGAFYSEECMDEFFKDKQVEFEFPNEDDNESD